MVLNNDPHLGTISSLKSSDIAKYLLFVEKINRRLKDVLSEVRELQSLTTDKTISSTTTNCDIIFFPKNTDIE